MYAMESASKDEVVVGGEFVESITEITVVNKPAGFVEHEDGQDHGGLGDVMEGEGMEKLGVIMCCAVDYHCPSIFQYGSVEEDIGLLVRVSMHLISRPSESRPFLFFFFFLKTLNRDLWYFQNPLF